MQRMIMGFWVSRAICGACGFRIPDLLKDGPRTSAELAAASGTHPRSLYRLLRALASVGVLQQLEDSRFASTPLAATLESDRPGTMRYFAMAELGQEHYSAWEEFPRSIETGEMAFTARFKQTPWEYYAEHPAHAEVFNNAMTGLTQFATLAVLMAYDFNPYTRIADIGGGHGALLAAALGANPAATGVLFDAPPVVAGAQANSRIEAVGGDFFESVPAGCDLYMMKWILHDWNDDQCVQILSNCRRAMAPGAKVLAIDAVLEPPPGDPFKNFMDLNMLVMTGGCERTEAEFRTLFDRAGLAVTRVLPTASPFGIVEAIAK